MVPRLGGLPGAMVASKDNESCDAAGSEAAGLLGDTWSLDPSTARWTSVGIPGASPPARTPPQPFPAEGLEPPRRTSTPNPKPATRTLGHKPSTLNSQVMSVDSPPPPGRTGVRASISLEASDLMVTPATNKRLQFASSLV